MRSRSSTRSSTSRSREQEGDFDADTRWAVSWFEQYGFKEGEYGVAETLATARNTSVAGIAQAGILRHGGGKVRLLRPEELAADWDPATDTRRPAWESVHQLIRAQDEGGDEAVAELIHKLGPDAEPARELAYRLYVLSDRKKWAKEALAYNSLVQGWSAAAVLARDVAEPPSTEQSPVLRGGLGVALTNQQRVGKTLELLKDGLAPYVGREFDHRFKDRALDEAQRYMYGDRLDVNKPIAQWDSAALLKLMWNSWNDVFRDTLGPAERSLVSELRGTRNRWAHQDQFTSDDAYRAMDSAERLLVAVSAEQADDLDKMKMELLRVRFEEQLRTDKRREAKTAIESPVTGTLKPWREVVSPHPDVAGGQYQQAEFAADLWQVHIGQGTDEYRDPAEFFRRTYLTASLQSLLETGIKRLGAGTGDPVVQLQTNFGGGKTHSMLALYHLFSGTPATDMVGVEQMLAETGGVKLPQANRVVLVGNKISPGRPEVKADGTVVQTLWGELAWQLGLRGWRGCRGAQGVRPHPR